MNQTRTFIPASSLRSGFVVRMAPGGGGDGLAAVQGLPALAVPAVAPVAVGAVAVVAVPVVVIVMIVIVAAAGGLDAGEDDSHPAGARPGEKLHGVLHGSLSGLADVQHQDHTIHPGSHDQRVRDGD